MGVVLGVAVGFACLIGVVWAAVLILIAKDRLAAAAGPTPTGGAAGGRPAPPLDREPPGPVAEPAGWTWAIRRPLAALAAPGIFLVVAAIFGPLLVVQLAAFGYFWLRRKFLGVPIPPPMADPPDEGCRAGVAGPGRGESGDEGACMWAIRGEELPGGRGLRFVVERGGRAASYAAVAEG